MIVRYDNFINEDTHYSDIGQLRYYIFDWDDNILHMNTKIVVKHKVNGEWIDEPISTSQYAKVRNLFGNGEWDIDYSKAFLDFRDYGDKGDNAFLYHIKEAINKKQFGPSWQTFIKALVDGSLFGIVTSRGHSPENIRTGVEYIIYDYLNDSQQSTMLNNLMKFYEAFDEDFDYLIDNYLDNCYFIGIMSEYFKNKFHFNTRQDQEGAKKLAIDYIVSQFRKYTDKTGLITKVGFSDDDTKFSKVASDIFKQNKNKFGDMDYYVFDTSDPSIKGGKKIKI